MTDNRFAVEDRPAESRYVLIDAGEGSGPTREAGQEVYADLVRESGTERIFYHTAVSDDYAGQGLASVLVRGAVEHAVSLGYSVVPVCPYVVDWFKKHPDYVEHEVTATPEHLRAVSERQG